jgi:uncharacterized membrane-anchored protein
MDEKEPADGWTPGRVIGLVLGLICMVGFGLVGLCGAFFASISHDASLNLLVVIAFALCLLSLWLVVAMISRGVRKRRDRA